VKYKERKKCNKQNLQTRNYKKDARRGLGLGDKKDETKNISKERTKHALGVRARQGGALGGGG
jgi:hypothetical protein